MTVTAPTSEAHRTLTTPFPLDPPVARAAWQVGAAIWLALAALLAFGHPEPFRWWIPGWAIVLMVVVAAVKAALLIVFYPPLAQLVGLAKGAVVASALTAVGLTHTAVAPAEVAVLWVLLGGGQVIVALAVWRRW